jgi:hypothetical protein
MRARTRLVTGGDGATLWLLTRRTGAPLRPQRELGIAALGVGRVTTGSDSAASARRSAGRTTGDEVSGADSASQRGGLRADGRCFHSAPLRHTASRATLRGLAGRRAHGARTHPCRAGPILENAAAGAGRQAGRGGSRARTGDGGCHSASRRQAARRSSAEHGPPATRTNASPARKRASGTRPDDGTNRKGTGS